MENLRKLDRVTSSSAVLQMDYSLNNSGHFDLWKTETPSRPSSADLQTSQSFPPLTNFTSTLEFEPVPSLFSLSTCPPNYRDIQIFKEKGSHDIADALLSLKHPIVHPSQFSAGPISPLSPTPAMPYFTSSHQGFNSGMTSSCTQGLPYPHNPPVLHNTYSSVPPQYPPQYETGQLSPTQPPTPNVHFPSMSVNVSMSMNVGVPPGLGNGQYNNLQQQWGNQPQSPTLSQYHGGHAPGIQAQYTGYGPQTHPFQGSYSFTPELRTHVPESRGFYYKAEGLKDVARFCASGHFKKSKFLSERNSATSFNEACTMKTNFCRICGKTYARPSTLKTHLRTHSGEKPYKCHICSKSFSQAANLTAHTRTHSGEKPFRCPVCERRFSQSSSVTTHMRTHSGERPYRCRLCKKAFSDSSTLTKHLRIHSGEKPYQCKLCLLRFSQSGNLNRHMRVHANNN